MSRYYLPAAERDTPCKLASGSTDFPEHTMLHDAFSGVFSDENFFYGPLLKPTRLFLIFRLADTGCRDAVRRFYSSGFAMRASASKARTHRSIRQARRYLLLLPNTISYMHRPLPESSFSRDRYLKPTVARAPPSFTASCRTDGVDRHRFRHAWPSARLTGHASSSQRYTADDTEHG